MLDDQLYKSTRNEVVILDYDVGKEISVLSYR
jgi:hypothetical protein